MGGINITINNKTAIYQCNNLTLMFKEPTQNNNFWIAELYNVKEMMIILGLLFLNKKQKLFGCGDKFARSRKPMGIRRFANSKT